MSAWRRLRDLDRLLPRSRCSPRLTWRCYRGAIPPSTVLRAVDVRPPGCHSAGGDRIRGEQLPGSATGISRASQRLLIACQVPCSWFSPGEGPIDLRDLLALLTIWPSGSQAEQHAGKLVRTGRGDNLAHRADRRECAGMSCRGPPWRCDLRGGRARPERLLLSLLPEQRQTRKRTTNQCRRIVNNRLRRRSKARFTVKLIINRASHMKGRCATRR